LGKERGFTMVSNDFIWSLDINFKEKIVGIAIMSFHPSYPSLNHLSKICGLSRSTIKRTIKSLILKNVMTYKKGKQNQTSNEYFVNEKFNPKLGSHRTQSRVTQTLALGSQGPSNKTNKIKLINKRIDFQSLELEGREKEGPLDPKISEMIRNIGKYSEIP
jgi:DNA-binding MarR family transcriptional regulator